MNDTPVTGPDFSGSGPVEYRHAEHQPATQGPAERVRAREEARLLAIPGVVSVGIGFGPPGREAIAIGVTDGGIAASLPREIDGIPVTVTVTGPVDALRQR